MTHIRTGVLAVVLATATATAASAFPAQPDPALHTSPTLTPELVVNGYGPLRNGIYGRHRYHHRGRSYGTGYHGRGTRTGGPVGGIPSRN